MESAICPTPKLIETFAWVPDRGFIAIDLHLARLLRGASALGYPADIAAIMAALTVSGDGPQRVRITLDAQGKVDMTSAPLAPNPPRWVVQVSEKRLTASDPWLRIKTTNRALYNAERAALPDGIDEWLFMNERDELCEGTITNLFAVLADGTRVTPPVSSGVLPGILRQQLLYQGWQERVITLDDLRSAREIMVGNALRGLIRADIAPIA